VQGGNDIIHTPFGAVSTFAFQHLAFVFDGSTVTTYLNGMAAGSDPWSGALHMESFKLGMNRTYNRPFAGAVDEVHIFSRALAASEIAAIAAAGSVSVCN